jgi:hypothetical protein
VGKLSICLEMTSHILLPGSRDVGRISYWRTASSALTHSLDSQTVVVAGLESAPGYVPSLDANERASAMRSRSGRFEAGAGTGGRPVRQEQAQGILVAALGMLAAHFGYDKVA